MNLSNWEKYWLIKNSNLLAEMEKLSLKKYCEILELPRSIFYWQKNKAPVSWQDIQDFPWRYKIEKVLLKHPYYGYRSMHAKLQRTEKPLNRKKIQRLMRKFGLAQKRKIKFKPAGKLDKVYPNLTADLKICRPHQLWAADLTYINTLEQTLYLLAIIDCFTRKIVGWNLADNYETAAGLSSLNQAFSRQEKRMNFQELMHHSDQGFPYRAKEYTSILKRREILISMSRTGTPTDNPFIESFFKTLKYNEVYLKEYQNFADAHDNIQYFIEEDYNRQRLHSSLNYLSPVEFERNFFCQKK